MTFASNVTTEETLDLSASEINVTCEHSIDNVDTFVPLFTSNCNTPIILTSSK